MDWRRILYSEVTAWAVVGVMVVAAAFGALAVFGWLGFAAIGFIGALITVRQGLFGDQAVIDADHGTGAVPLMSAQTRARSGDATADASPHERAMRARRAKLLRALTGTFVAMAAFGVLLHVLRTGG